MEYILFDAVFHALPESQIKKMEDKFFDPFLIEILPADSIFFNGPSSVHPLSSVLMSFQKYAIYTVR